MRFSVIFLFLCITLSLFALPFELTTSTQADLFKVQSQRGNEVVLHFQLPSIEIEKETINGKEYVRIKHTYKPQIKQYTHFLIKNYTSRPISRVLSKAVIYLRLLSPVASSDLPTGQRRVIFISAPAWSCSGWGLHSQLVT